MIGKLKGIIDCYGEDSVILDVNGVGYLVHCSARTLQELPRAGEPVTLSIETHVREDQIRLFGFHDRRRARMVPAVADRAGRRHQGGARRARHAQARRSRLRHRACATRRWWRARRASGRKSPSASSPSSRTRRRPIPMSIRRWCGCPARSTRSARRSRLPTRSRRWSISAMASRRPPPPSPPRRAAPARAPRCATLIRLGLKELAK